MPPPVPPTPPNGYRLIDDGQAEFVFRVPPLPPAAPPPPLPPPMHAEDLPLLRHTKGFESVVWGGVKYAFKPKQRLVVAALIDAAREGHEFLSQSTLLEVAESNGGRLRDLFRDNPAWGTMIQQGILYGFPRDTYCLVRPPDPDAGDPDGK